MSIECKYQVSSALLRLAITVGYAGERKPEEVKQLLDATIVLYVSTCFASQ